MPSRNNSMIRRDINRLNNLITRHSGKEGALDAIADIVQSASAKVNSAWQAFQAATIAGNKERGERDTAVKGLTEWIQRWRPVIFLKVPGVEGKIRSLPGSGATADDLARVAEDMVVFINGNPGAGSFKEKALKELGDKIEKAEKETSEAVAAYPHETACRDAFTEACLAANTILVRGLEIVRTAFGPTSPEYKQFIARDSNSADEEEDVPAGVSS